MNVQINQLVKSLFGKDSLDQCSVLEIEEYAEKHPYLGAVQLVLAKKLQTVNSERFNGQLEKIFLYFNNPLWVEHLLNDTGNAEVISQYSELYNHQEKESKEKMIDLPENDDSEIAGLIETSESVGSELTAAVEEEQVSEENSPEFTLPTFKMKEIDVESQILFQPFYTVDYFASQGINAREDDKPSDKFGQQLKSFTDWLKKMKRLPGVENQISTDLKSDQKVEQMAEFSVKDRNVVTETMADVWEKQGKTEKAIDIYNKLSLLEPSKSVYFAAKIEALKKLN